LPEPDDASAQPANLIGTQVIGLDRVGGRAGQRVDVAVRVTLAPARLARKAAVDKADDARRTAGGTIDDAPGNPDPSCRGKTGQDGAI
jgi:hypothetical protein